MPSTKPVQLRRLDRGYHAWVDMTEATFGPGPWSDIRECVDGINGGSRGSIKAGQVGMLKTLICEVLKEWDDKAKASSLLAHILQAIHASDDREKLALSVIRNSRLNLGREGMVHIILETVVILNSEGCGIPSSKQLANVLTEAGAEILVNQDRSLDVMRIRFHDSIKKLGDPDRTTTVEQEVKAVLPPVIIFHDVNLARPITPDAIATGKVVQLPRIR